MSNPKFAILVTSVFSEHQDNENYYGDFIRNFDARCQKSIVRIRCPFKEKDKKYIMTGVVVASNGTSCSVITSHHINKENVVEFFDGTRAKGLYVKSEKKFNMGIMHVIGLDGIHWEVANFSQDEATLGQKVFTLGYNNDNAESLNHIKEDGTTVTTNFISGSLVRLISI